MANLKHIRSQIKSVISIQKVTKAMKMVAAAKLRKSQERMEQSRPYSKRLENLIQHLLQDVNRSMLPLLNKRNKIQNHGFFIITADRGMAGAFNANVIKKTEQILNEFNSKNCFLICIGKKSHDYFKRRDYQILDSYRDFWNSLNINQAIDIGNTIVSKYIDREFDAVDVIYNNSKVGMTYNIGDQNELTNLELINIIYKIMSKNKTINKKIKFVNDRFGHDKRYSINIDKIKKDFNWEPENLFLENLELVINNYLK